MTRSEAGGRLDRFLQTSLGDLTRSQIKRLADRDLVLVNGKPVKAGHLLRAGETVEVVIPPAPAVIPEPEDLPLSVVHEDEAVLVVDKPPGMTVHPGAGVDRGTLVNALLGAGVQLSEVGAPLRPGIVHRLDKGTSGLLVVAKTDAAHRALARDLAARRIHRRYWALVWGAPRARQGTIRQPLARSRGDRRRIRVVPRGGREAVTRYRVVGVWQGVGVVWLELETGRTHQIRAHMKHMGHPVFGDPEYGGRSRGMGRSREEQETARRALAHLPRQALHAAVLEFRHPATEESLVFTSGVPEDIQKAADALGIPSWARELGEMNNT